MVRNVVAVFVVQPSRWSGCLFVLAFRGLTWTKALLPPRRLAACDTLTRSRLRFPLNRNESIGRCCDHVAPRMSIEMDSNCRVLSCGYNLVTDKTREAELRGSWSLAIRVLLTRTRSGLARGSRDSHATSLNHLFRVFRPVRCSVGLAIELDDLRSVYQSVQHRHHDLQITQVVRPALEVHVRYHRGRAAYASIDHLVKKTQCI